MRFASLLSGEFTTMAVINPSKRKLTKFTSVNWGGRADYPFSLASRFLRPFGIRRRIEVGFPPATTGARASVNTGRPTGKPVVGKEKVIYLTLYQCKALIMYPSFEWQRRSLAWPG